MNEERPFLTREDFDRAEQLYPVKDDQYQNACISYMYGVDFTEAANMKSELSEQEIANACDYFMTRDLPLSQKQTFYQGLLEWRNQIEKEYGLSPLDAIAKREELSRQQFADAVADLMEPKDSLKQ